ncbi:hypothetical protein GCM10018785_55680 [Streptomyces longispororuber]|uniref:SCO6045-like C-terminal domain-containing protein n=1 Tax=Streptomyces longispororuber TaxID=68230 RepID=A0A919DUH9_9ACTN|nr:DUF692 domain-containing protein [Streptomyces longispororuber]GHE80491.1 hypothetical protein GCM10018785_55680 [Streptomyces longispororuber]
MVRLGTGIGWRPEIADAVERMTGIDWVEVVAENVCPGHLPDSLARLRERGVTVVPHGVSLGLGGADRPDEARLAALAERATALGAPLVTEHIAFVRAGGPLTASQRLEAGHLLPVPRTRDALAVLCENVRAAQDALPVPLAVENIAALFSWPGEEMTEGQFLYELVERTGVRLLIDVANLHTNHVNRGEDPVKALDGLPVEALAYVHVAGGFERDGVWHDSHAHPVPPAVLDVLAELASRTAPPGVLLERDENFPEPAELERELEQIRTTVRRAVAGASAGASLPAGAAAEVRGPAGAVAGLSVRAEALAGVSVSAEAVAGVSVSAEAVAGVSVPAEVRVPAGAAAEVLAPAGTGAAAEAAAAVPATAVLAGVPAQGRGPAGAADEVLAQAAVRERVALAQTSLLSALVAGTPAPEGFDRVRLAVQGRALAAKRADVVAKVAPELPDILGAAYRKDFLAYAARRPMTDGYRRDALAFAEHLLLTGRPEDADARGRLTRWWLDRSGPRPLEGRPVARWLRAARFALRRRHAHR